MPMKVGDSSQDADPASVYVLVVNPYSQHKEEAIRYLEYCAQNVYDETQYRIFANITDPLPNTYQEKYRYTIDAEDIAAWKQVAGNIVVPEENYFTADLKKLVERLSTGNLTVEAFTQEGNRYFEMVYQERGE